MLRAIMVCVDYLDLLEITLPYNRHHFKEVWVVTNHQDASLVTELCSAFDAKVFITDAFTRNGAGFNKWLALEEGLDHIGREGWLCLMDADVVWPAELKVSSKNNDIILGTWPNVIRLSPGNLCTPYRRMWDSFPVRPKWMEGQPYGLLPPTVDWYNFPIHRNIKEWAGYSQIFHASDRHLPPPPWHDTNWKHAGGADSFFQARWLEPHKVRPPFEVLHLGPAGVNWYGRASAYRDGSVPDEAQQRAELVRGIWEGRWGKKGDDRYRHEKLS